LGENVIIGVAGTASAEELKTVPVSEWRLEIITTRETKKREKGWF